MMASIYDLKPKFQDLLRPLVARLAKAGVTPNQITISAVLLSILGGGVLFLFPETRWALLMIPLVLFVRMALNAIDGMLAREHAMQSRLGAVLNEVGDVLSDIALYLPLAGVVGFEAHWVVLVVLSAVVGEMAGVMGIQIGAQRRYDGPMGKSDRAFWFGLMGLLIGVGIPIGVWVNVLLVIMLVLSCLTIVNRLRKALQEGS